MYPFKVNATYSLLKERITVIVIEEEHTGVTVVFSFSLY